METFRSSSSSSLKLFSDKYHGDKDRGFFFPKDSLLNLPAKIRFLRPPTSHKHAINLSFSLSKTHEKPIFTLSSMSSSDTQNEQTEINEIISQSKTVHVKFQLQRECAFGQHFHVVGDDPMFGLWDPADAVPLNWSDGHVWTAELDIPTGKCIKFKIILKQGPENIIWQPGPDRILQTWETKNTITVCEDWDNAELRKILEDEPTSNQNEDIPDPNEKLHIDTSNRQPDAISDEDMDRLILGSNSRMVNVEDSEITSDEDNVLSMNGLPLLVPGLTPVPNTHTEEASVAEVETSIFSDAIEAEKIKELNVPELELKEEVPENKKQEQHQCEQAGKPQLAEEQGQEKSKSVDHVLENNFEAGKPRLAEEQEKSKSVDRVLENNIEAGKSQLAEEQDQEKSKSVDHVVENDIEAGTQLAEEQGQENSKSVDHVLENDIQWGQRTLQKLLANFGFQ